MSTKADLALAKLELETYEEKLRAIPYYYSQHDWKERAVHKADMRKISAKISRLESKLIKEAGPIVHQDGLGQLIKPGARVVWSDSGRYAGFRNVFYVSYNNPKLVAICREKVDIGNKNRATNVRPDVILVVDKILGP